MKKTDQEGDAQLACRGETKKKTDDEEVLFIFDFFF